MASTDRPLLIIGAGNVGGYLALNLERLGVPHTCRGFLDDDPAKFGTTRWGLPVLGPTEAIQQYPAYAVLVGISAPRVRKRIVQAVSKYTDEFPSVIAPGAWVSAGVSVGRGVIVYPGVSINYETELGSFCIVNMNCAIGHNCTLEPFSTLAPGVNLAGFTTIGSESEVGIGSATRQGVVIGHGAVVGGQSMVLADVSPEQVVAGVPARPISRIV